MPERSRRRFVQSSAVGCCVVLVMVSTSCTGGAPHDATTHARGSASATLRVLQLNLCNSGIAGCYTGRSVATAAALIRAQRPDVVTLNEVCSDDIPVLQRALSGAEHGGTVISAFKAAVQRNADEPVRCRNGRRYGIGLLARVRAPYRGYTSDGARYPTQDPADTERRVWLCVRAIGHFYACTTHLSSTSPMVAFRQCRHLMDHAIPAVRRPDRNDPVILGADLNLPDGAPPDPKSCLPPGFRRADDGARQDVVVSSALRVVSSRSISMRASTDHPGLLVALAPDPAH